jgi:hypothetical protein
VAVNNRYSQIIERIFFSYYQEGMKELLFRRTDIERVAAELNIKLPLNLGDVVYSFRYRASLPERIKEKAPEGGSGLFGLQADPYTSSFLSLTVH